MIRVEVCYMFCSSCGKILASTDAFCPGCGKRTGDAKSDTIPSRSSSDKKKRWFSGMPQAILILIIIFSVIHFFDSHGNSSTVTSNVVPSRSFVQQIESGGSTCSTGDIKIKGLTGTEEDGGFANITGTLINNCPEPVGVQLKVTLFDKSGNVVDTQDMWPASISNIPPRIEYPFKDLMSVERSWSKYSVVAINVRHWR
jgi:hypothetical protein